MGIKAGKGTDWEVLRGHLLAKEGKEKEKTRTTGLPFFGEGMEDWEGRGG